MLKLEYKMIQANSRSASDVTLFNTAVDERNSGIKIAGDHIMKWTKRVDDIIRHPIIWKTNLVGRDRLAEMKYKNKFQVAEVGHK